MKLKIALLILAALVTSTAVRAELITNGGFETGDFSGWTLSGNTQNVGVCASGSFFPGAPDLQGSLCTANSGNFSAALGPYGDPVHLSQTVATTAGELYALTFFLRTDNGGLDPTQLASLGPQFNSFDVNFGGTNFYSFSDLADSNLAFTGITLSTNLVASGDTTMLEFVTQNQPGGFFLDDVSLAPVPEPASFLLLTVALLGFGLVRRKRRTA